MVGIHWQLAQDFCTWDGGRALPTEAQWEKAARGPSPREVLNPWGDTVGTCELSGGKQCLGSNWVPDPVDSHPLGISHYGLYNMAANAMEWVGDWYEEFYYATSPTQDPTGPVTGTMRVIRGFGFEKDLVDITESVTHRAAWTPNNYDNELGFRCARPGI